MEKFLLILFGIAFLSVLSNAQDIGRIRRMMLMRQRELALRRAGFPFGARGIGGPGIPPPVAARLALMQRQIALRNPFIRPSIGPFGSSFPPFSSRAAFGLGSPFGSSFSVPGPSDISRFDLSTINFPPGATFGDADGLATVGNGGLAAIGPVGQANGPQGGNGNIFGQQPAQAAEFLDTRQEDVRPVTADRAPGHLTREPPRPDFRSREENAVQSRPEIERLQGPSNGPGVGGRGPPPQLSEGMFSAPPRVPRLGPPLPPPALPLPREMVFPPLPQSQQPRVPFERRLPNLPSRRRGRNQQRGRRPQRRQRGSQPPRRGPRVFPNVPEVVQIPAVPATEGQQSNDVQMGAGLTQAGAGQISDQAGGQTGGQMSGQFGSQIGGQMGGQMGGPMGGQMGGPMGSQMGGPMGGQMGGPMGGQMGGPMGGQMGGPIGGQMGGPMGGQMGAPFGGSVGTPFTGQMSGQFGSQMSGPTFSFAQQTGGQFPTGFQSQGAQGSAIFPSQSTQGPIMRQRTPSFNIDSSFQSGLQVSGPPTVFRGFPNGQALQFPEGVQSFGPSDQLIIQAGGLTPDVFTSGQFSSSRFPGISGPRFEPSFGGAASNSNGAVGQTLGGRTGQSQMPPNFGFVGPSDNAAGPAFNTESLSSAQNFNIQFQPLRPMPQIPQIPERQPSPSLMGIGTGVGTFAQSSTGLNTDISRQSGAFQFGSSADSIAGGMQFTGSGLQTGLQAGSTGTNSKFTNSESATVTETAAGQELAGTMTFGTDSQSETSATASVSMVTPETGISSGDSEFRLVEVGNILGDKGYVDSLPAIERVGAMEASGGQSGSEFQPNGDIASAFQSFGAVDQSETVVDLSLPTENTAVPGNAPDQFSLMEIATGSTSGQTGSTAGTGSTFGNGSSSATGSTTVTNTTSTSSTITFKDGPFAASLNQDFSFFMDQNDQPPNDMPPITFNAPEPPVFGTGETKFLTFPVQGTGGAGLEGSNALSQGHSFISNTSTTESKMSTGGVQNVTRSVAGETNTAIGGFV